MNSKTFIGLMNEKSFLGYNSSIIKFKYLETQFNTSLWSKRLFIWKWL